MPPDRSRQLVYELDAWYRSHTVRQKDLATSLGVSPQSLAEILGLRNKPTGEQALRIAEFLKTNNMTTVDQPKTLSSALDRIGELIAELENLKAKAMLPAAPAKTPTPPNALAVPRPPAAATPPAVKTIDQMTTRELIDACDSAAAAGNTEEANRLYLQISKRKANR